MHGVQAWDWRAAHTFGGHMPESNGSLARLAAAPWAASTAWLLVPDNALTAGRANGASSEGCELLLVAAGWRLMQELTSEYCSMKM